MLSAFEKMTEDQFANIDNLSETVKSIQNCLQCTICLEMMSSPVKTRCGHTFCRTCIATVLNKKNSKCPLCNTSLQRRSISKDKHTGLCINSFERLVRAIREDINIDILSHTKNPRNTRESCQTPTVSRRSTNDTSSKKKGSEKISSFFTKKTSGEQSAGPSNRDILDETSASCSEYKKDNAIKKDDSAERRNRRKESSSDGLSGVYPLLRSPHKNQNANDEVISSKEERIESWLETLPDTEFLENPLASPNQDQNCLDDTVTVISDFSSVSCEKIYIKKEKEESSTTEHLTGRDSVQEHLSDSIKEQRLSKGSSRGGNNTRGKNKRRTTRSFPEKKIPVNSTERKLKYEMTHAKVRERCIAAMEKSAKTSGDSLISTTDAADSSKHLVEPGNTTRETWNTVVQFGKEMRTKRNKLKSLDVSVQSTNNTKLSDEFVSNKSTKNRKVSSTNLQIRSKIVDGGQNDSIEKQNESGLRYLNESGQRLSPPDNHTSFESKQEQRIQQNTSFISLDEEGRVPISSLRREQMNDIIGITTKDKDTNFLGSTETLVEDHGTVPKKRLSLRKRSECSKNSDRSPPQLTPMKVNLEERYELLRESSLSPKNVENTPAKSDGNSWKTESMSKLSLKKRSPNSTNANKVPISYDVSQLSSVKCNLMEQMNRSEVKRRESVGNVETISKIDQERRNDVRAEKKLECDTRTNIVTSPSTEKTHVVPFSKLGKVFRKRRKVKFYKLGSLRRESATCTLSTSISNASRVNVITLLASEDTLETSKISEEECSLENMTSGSSINRIDVVDKKNDEVKTTKYLTQSQDSLGVLLVSLKDEVSGNKRNDNSGPLRDISEIRQCNKVDFGKSSKKAENVSSNQNEIRISEPKGAHSKPVIISVVRMMSPEKDSQLKFLHLNSPSNTISERMFVQQMKKSKRNSVQKLRANSSEQSDMESNNDTKKRKRSSDISDKIITDNVNERIRKNKHDLDSENDSDCSESSKNVTQIEKLNENVNKLIKSRRTMDGIISLSSDEDNPKRTKTENVQNESRKPYKRIIVPTSGSDTDPGISTKEISITDERKKDKNVSTVKRKRIPSADSDNDTLVNEIMTNWCNGLDTSRRSSKKGKLEETKITKATSSKTTIQPPESLEFDSWNNFQTPVKRTQEKELQDRSNNDIIDKVRLIRMNDNIESKSKKEQDVIGDNFDEAMAEVMTHSLGTNFFSGENMSVNSRQPEKGSLGNKSEENRVHLMSSYVETNDLFAETNRSKVEENSKDFDKTLMENLNDSNKENNVKEENTRFLRNNGQRDTSNGGVKLTNERKIDKPFEGRSTPMSDVKKYKEFKNQNQMEEAKQSYEYDSLMDVTQDQLLLKALEEDLFGSANSRSLAKSATAKTTSPERRLEKESRTPRKVGKRNLGNKDEESSSDENDIIENTPQSQKKFIEVDHSTQSRARKSLNVSQTTPVSRKNFKATTTTTTVTPSTIVGKLKTPIDQNKIRPLYQSTPKIIQATSNREKELPKFVEENKKALESISDSRERSVMQVKDESTRNANQSRDKRQLCFVWSSLAALQIESIKKLATLFGACCTHNFIPAVTHVIVSTKEENNAATKTLKFLQGIAYRKFVVGFKWVVDCLKEGRLLDEEPYEAVDCYTLEPGPRKSRLRQSNLFHGFAFLCVEPFPNITVTQCQDLLKGVGATIVESIGALANVKDMYKVILLQNEVHKDEVVADWYKKTSAVPVSCDWIVECISQYKLVSCYMYLHEIVPEDILKSGYPEEMIDPEEFNSTCDTSAGN